ncbi:hypothetical protein [Microbacterium sp. 179-I 3D4 NHS]|uniref:hypothetical protein n=1 Tax=Microbacterium sp. 179-I 3D4 NHS TaxID=3142381 RepID=UPI0039A0F13D
MNEPQVWVLIGVFAAGTIGMVTVVSTLFVQVLKSEIRTVHAGIDHLGDRIDHLDRDISAVFRHVFGIDRS